MALREPATSIDLVTDVAGEDGHDDEEEEEEVDDMEDDHWSYWGREFFK